MFITSVVPSEREIHSNLEREEYRPPGIPEPPLTPQPSPPLPLSQTLTVTPIPCAAQSSSPAEVQAPRLPLPNNTYARLDPGAATETATSTHTTPPPKPAETQILDERRVRWYDALSISRRLHSAIRTGAAWRYRLGWWRVRGAAGGR